MKYKKYFVDAPVIAAVVTMCGLCIPTVKGDSAPPAHESVEVREGNLTDKILGNPENGRKILLSTFKDFQTYRQNNAGSYPPPNVSLMSAVQANPILYGYKDWYAVGNARISPDNIYDGRLTFRRYATKIATAFTLSKRVDGSLLGQIKTAGTKDVLSYINTYYWENPATLGNKRASDNPIGFYLVLWDDGVVKEVPYDKVFYSFSPEEYFVVFPNQAGVPSTTVTYEEWMTTGLHKKAVPIGYPINPQTKQPNQDNGGYESLVALSRLLNAPDEREPIWDALGRTNNIFNLKQVREGASKLKLALQQKKLTLAQLQKLNTPAIVQQKDKHIVTLAQAGIEYSIVQDQGMTRIVRNEQLAALLNGEVLIPQAITTPLPLRADNPVRVVLMKTTNDSSVQTITLTNDGKTPLNLEIERPIPGVTQAQLSSKTLAPGASATLTLTIKWREILPGDTQDVYATLRTDNPQQPRLMMGFQLNLPAAPPLSATPSGTPPELP